MNIKRVSYKCDDCGRRCSFSPADDGLDAIQTVSVIMDILGEPICGACVMAQDNGWDNEVESSPRYWFEGPGGGACACGSYSCDGGCDSYAMRCREEKEEEYYYAHLDPNAEFCECDDPDCRCHPKARGLDPDNREDMTGQYVEQEVVDGTFSLEGFMENDTIEHALYMSDGSYADIPF